MVKEIPVPADAAARARRGNALKRKMKCANCIAFALALLAVLSLVACVGTAVALQFQDGWNIAFPIAVGCLLAGACVCALGAFVCALLGARTEKRATDYFERCDGEESFTVGEETFATFSLAGVRIHSPVRETEIPYAEMRFFSVCSRRAPRERGKWSVVMEIPARYISKEGKEPVLVQTDAKERLYRTLERHGIALEGEKRTEEKGKKFVRKRAFRLPARTKRRNALALLAFGCAVALAAIPIGIWWDLSVCVATAVLGVFLVLRASYSFARAHALLALYDEGLYWRESGRGERIFLKWEEIVRVGCEEEKNFPLLRAECAYGAYRFPRAEGAYEAIGEMFPEKCGKKR